MKKNAVDCQIKLIFDHHELSSEGPEHGKHNACGAENELGGDVE
jgi:hypothetical protein